MAKKSATQVKVRVFGGPDPRNKKEIIGQPLLEDGVIRQPGEEFTVDEDRAAALGDSVVIIGPVEAPKEAPKA